MTDYRDLLTDDTIIELAAKALREQLPPQFRDKLQFNSLYHREVINNLGISRRSYVTFEPIQASLDEMPPNCGATDTGLYAIYYVAPVAGVSATFEAHYGFMPSERSLLKAIGRIQTETSKREFLSC